MMRLVLVLKRATRLFAVFTVLVVAALAVAYLFDSAGVFRSSALYRVVELLVPEWLVYRWIFGQPDQEDPILFFHLIIVGVEGHVVFVLRYFLVCLALAFCWTWIEARTTST